MFRPYLAILRQLFTFRNRHTALVLKSKYFNAIAYFVLHTKIHLFENITLYPFLPSFPLAASVSFVLFGAHKNNNYNTTTPMFIALNKTQKHGRHNRKTARERIKSYVLKQINVSVNNEIGNSIEIF
jgi:hypothetical protein